MIYIVIGTKAQLIKMAPVMKALEEQGLPYRYISTGQHRDTTTEILENFKLRHPDTILYDGPDITSIPSMIIWGMRILWRTLRKRESIFGNDQGGIILVHGDTFSTLLGALMGRFARLTVGHVESGLRSFRLLHPFPEELTRLIVFRLSHVYFCPGPWAVKNLTRYSGEKINTISNTLRDALHIAVTTAEASTVSIPKIPYAITSIHRFENIYSFKKLERVVSIVIHISERIPVLFILHKPTEKKLRAFGLYDRLANASNIELRQRYDYFRFIKLLTEAEFAISDGGSNQEECHYLGKPILLLRMATERLEGLGSNCTLSRYNLKIIDDFLDNYRQWVGIQTYIGSSPSQIIAQACIPYYKGPHGKQH